MFDGYYYSYKKAKDPQKTIKELKGKGIDINPIIIQGAIAKNWWAKAWNKNIESYSDFYNRISRGRSYLRSGAVIDLKIKEGEVKALVQGTRKKPYEIIINIKTISEAVWIDIVNQCKGKIESLEKLIEGEFPKDIMDLFNDRYSGLFPSPSDIKMDCSCPDYAYVCKHIAAVFYAIGAKFDDDPTLFFTLRGVNFEELLKKAVDEKMDEILKKPEKYTSRIMKDVNIKELFDL